VTTEDLQALPADGFAHLRAAQGVQARSTRAAATGVDPDGLVEVVVDRYGLLADTVRAPDVAQLAAQLVIAAAARAMPPAADGPPHDGR
jgi:hypothetical protein